MSDLPRRIGPTAAAAPPDWGLGDRRTHLLFLALLVPALLLALVVTMALIGEVLRGDLAFFNTHFLFWGWSRFVHLRGPASLIYDPHRLAAFERGLPGAQPKNLPFVYPPPLLLLIWPLGWLRPVAGWLVWIGAGLGFYAWASAVPPWPVRTALLALIAPATLAAIYYTETSLLVAALLVGGCRLLDRRPVLAGVLFGLLFFKPQFGVLIPVALLAARRWRAIVAATATVLAEVLASGLCFGWDCWVRLPGALLGVSHLVARLASVTQFSPTVAAGLRMLGTGPALADAGQVVAAVAAAAVVWVCFRRGATLCAAAALLTGALLATPYAFFYDLTLASSAVVALVITVRHEGARLTTAEVLVLVLVLVLPLLILFNPLRLPWGLVVLPALLLLILRRQRCAARAPPAPG